MKTVGHLVWEAAHFNYPDCPHCLSGRGDPCRTPSFKTCKPHKERIEECKRQGIKVAD
jgi:hypothetical protein